MKVSSLIASASSLLVAYAQSHKSPVLTTNGTVLSVFIFHNHCDRTSLFLPDGTPGGDFGAPGAIMCYEDGTFYWNKYFREASALKIYGTSQIFNSKYVNAEVPNVDISIQSATAFMQGLFKPVDLQSTVTSGPDLLQVDNSTFMNGPLQGYQYTPITTYRSSDPQSIWIAGNLLACKAQKAASGLYYASEDYKEMFAESQPFYLSLYEDYFAGVFDKSFMVFFNAYILYDYVNQNRLAGNETLGAMSEDDFERLRVYANHFEFNLYANVTAATNPNWALDSNSDYLREMGGRLIAGKIARMFRDTIASGGWENKFNFVLSNFDIMLSFFAIANLTSRSDDFYGIPDLGSSMVFELYTDDPTLTTDGKIDPSSIKVAFGFRNGTSVDDTLTYWPLFDEDQQNVSTVYSKFLERMDAASVQNVGQWCSVCDAEVDFCQAEAVNPNSPSTTGTPDGSSGNVSQGNKNTMAPAVAGVIGAIIMLAILGIVAAIAFFAFGCIVKRERRRSSVFSSISNFGRNQPKEKMSSEIELPLSPTAAPMPQRFDEDDDDRYGTVSTVATKVASPLASPQEAHFKAWESRL